MEKKRINLSQSFIKSYTKVYNKEECGAKLQAIYLDKIIEPAPSQAALNGQYFEYLVVKELTGEHLRNRKGEIPEPPKTATGNISKADNEKIETQVKNIINLFTEYDIEVLSFNETLEYNFSENESFEFWRKGILDLRVMINNYYTIDIFGEKQKRKPFEAIIDIKYSANLDEKSKRNEYSFYLDPKFNQYEEKNWINSLENKPDLTIQAVEYKHLAKKVLKKDLPFFFCVASSTGSEQIELIEVNISQSTKDRHENNIYEISKMLNIYDCKLAANPKVDFCKKCVHFKCEERIKFSQFKSIEI